MKINKDFPTKQPRPGIEAALRRKIAVYTCITQGYDSLKIPQSIDEHLAYFCFTDVPSIIKPPWEYRPIELKRLSPKDQNRYIKMHPHEFLSAYDITLYIDGNIQIVGDLHSLILGAAAAPEDMFLYRHSRRNCVYSEAATCAYYSHDWIWTIASQMRRYSKAGYPVENGLYEANVIIRKNTDRMHRLMEAWWREYCTGARRDQLSLPYAAWRAGVPLGSLGDSDPRFGHRYFLLVQRPARRRLSVLLRKYINRAVAFVAPYENLFGLAAPLHWERTLAE